MNDVLPHTPSASPKQKRLALLFVLTLGLLVLLLISSYLWQHRSTQPTLVDDSTRPSREENNEPESTTAEAQADALLVVSTSNEVTAIEADIASTDLSNIHSEFTAIEAEFSAVTGQ